MRKSRSLCHPEERQRRGTFCTNPIGDASYNDRTKDPFYEAPFVKSSAVRRIFFTTARIGAVFFRIHPPPPPRRFGGLTPAGCFPRAPRSAGIARATFYAC